MDIIAGIVWPGEPAEGTWVWRHPDGGELVHWTGPAHRFDQAVEEIEEDPDGARVGFDLVELDLALLQEFDERMADTDRNLLEEIDALLAAVREAG